MFQVIEASDMVPIEFSDKVIIATSENSVWLLTSKTYNRIAVRAVRPVESDRIAYNRTYPHNRCFFFIDDLGCLRLRVMPQDDKGPYGMVSGVILSVYSLL